MNDGVTVDPDLETQEQAHLRSLSLLLGTEGYGVRRSWLELFSGLRGLGVSSSAIVLRRGELGSVIERSGIPTLYLDAEAAPAMAAGGLRKFVLLARRAISQLKLLRGLLKAVRQFKPDILLVQSPLEMPLVGLAAKLSGLKAYWLMPNAVASDYPFDLNRRIYRIAFNHLNVVPVANSSYTDSTLGPGRFERHVCHLGVDPQMFDPSTSPTFDRAKLGIPEDAVVLGVFARLVEEKGQYRLAEALAELGTQAEGVHVMLCGGPLDSAYTLRLKAFVQDRGMSGRFHFLGPVDDVVPYYKACDVVVNSRLDPEPFGLSVIEAMMLGKPVLVHKAGGPGETVVDGGTGWHVQGPETTHFVEGLRHMLRDIPRLDELGSAARLHALAHFTTEKMAGRVMKIILANGVRASSAKSPPDFAAVAPKNAAKGNRHG